MKHAVIISGLRKDDEKTVEAGLSEGRTVFLAQLEYTEEELGQFEREKMKWILRCRGSQQFLADSDAGEDARAYYCHHFDLIPEKTVFDEGKFVGIYLCNDGISYSGRGRYNYMMDDWGYPGADPFRFIPRGGKTHVFLFSDDETHRWDDWSLLHRDPDAVYKDYLDF